MNSWNGRRGEGKEKYVRGKEIRLTSTEEFQEEPVEKLLRVTGVAPSHSLEGPKLVQDQKHSALTVANGDETFNGGVVNHEITPIGLDALFRLNSGGRSC